MKRAIVVATLIALGACSSEATRVTADPTPTDPTASPELERRDVATDWYVKRIDGATVAFVYTMSGVASGCEKEGIARVTEDEEGVTITANKSVLVDDGRPCTEELAIVDAQVVLEEPLGKRQLRGCMPTADLQNENATCRDLGRTRKAGYLDFPPSS